MSPLLDKMFELHKRHSVLHELNDKLRQSGAAAAAREKQTARLKSEVQKLVDRRKKVQRSADAKELDIKTVQAKIAKMKGQLNEIKTNKEYQALQNEIKFAGIELRKHEDEELGLLEELEEISGKLAEAEAALKQAEGEAAEARSRAAAEAAALQAEIRKAEQDRDGIADQLPSQAVAVFNRVSTKHRDGAMCPLLTETHGQEGITYSCGGCHMRLTENAYVKLRGNTDELILCPNCSRILYLEP